MFEIAATKNRDRTLEEFDVEYLIKQPHRLREQRFIRRMTGDVAVKRDHGIYSQEGGAGRPW